MGRIFGTTLLLLASSAFAEKLCFTKFKGASSEPVRKQLMRQFCDDHVCIDPKRATKAGKPDFAKAKAAKIGFFINGTVKGKDPKSVLDIEVVDSPHSVKFKKSYSFSGKWLPKSVLNSAVAAMSEAMNLGASSEEKPAKPPPKEDVEEKPAETNIQPDTASNEVAATTPPPAKARVEPTPAEESHPAPRESVAPEASAAADEAFEAPPEKKAGPKASWIEVDLGVDIFSKSLSYTGQTSNNLRTYSAPLVVAPAGHIEFYPLAFITQGFLSGIGLDGSFSTAIELKTRKSGSETVWPTELFRYDGSLRFRIRPLSDSNFSITPFAGIAVRRFIVGAGAGGSLSGENIDGLPNVSYFAIRPGLAIEFPFWDTGFSVFGRFAAHIVMSSGQIISSNANGFFKKGDNLGLEGQFGVGYRIFGPVSVRLAFDITRYAMKFQTEETDIYRAQGAADLYLGGNGSVRLTF